MGWWCSGTGGFTILRVSVGWWCSGTGGFTILRVSVGWWCSGVHVRLLLLVVLPY